MIEIQPEDKCTTGFVHEFRRIEDGTIRGYRCRNCWLFHDDAKHEAWVARQQESYQMDEEFERELQAYLKASYPPEITEDQIRELRLTFLAGMMIGSRLIADSFNGLSNSNRYAAQKFIRRLWTSSKAANKR
jgi:hypothetical protein